MLKTIFKICSIFSENTFFFWIAKKKKKKKKKKKRFSGNFDLFSFLTLLDLIIHICIKTSITMRLNKVFSQKLHFLKFSPQNYAFHNRHSNVLLNGNSMSMQMISDEMHSDTIAIREKNTNRKVVR